MISFTLNNRQVSVDADPTTPLLWAIRDRIGLTGTKVVAPACAAPARFTSTARPSVPA
jgi:aerobic-type carbon monoxide dehydrogenase small subunit (CoxS/CutS family)